MQTATRNANYSVRKLDDTKVIMSYCHYLMMKGQLVGNFCLDGHKPTKEENEVAEQCSKICDIITSIVDNCSIKEVPELLDYYDIAYRIGNKCLPDSNFINKHKRRVFNAWKTGDRNIDESSVYRILMTEVVYHPESAKREYHTAYHKLKDKWSSTLKRFDRFPDTTSYENFQRLALMMRENIVSEFGGKSEMVKHQWYESNKLDNFTNVSSLLLRSYRRFVSSLFPAVFDYEDQLKLDNRILSELSTRSDLNPYDRQAFAMALRHNKEFNRS